MKLIKCPICKKQYLMVGLRNHIINSAKGEMWRDMNNLLTFAKGKPYSFSPRILLRHCKHVAYYRHNFKEINIKKLVI